MSTAVFETARRGSIPRQGIEASDSLTTSEMIMSNAYEKLLAHMSDKKIGFWSNREEEAICVDFPGIVGMYRVYAGRHGPEPIRCFRSSARERGGRCRAAVGETVERANYGLAGGNLEMSFDDSELRFHASEDLSGDDLDGNMINRLISAGPNGVGHLSPSDSGGNLWQ